MLRSFSYSYGSLKDGMTAFVIKEDSDELSLLYQKTSLSDGKEIRSEMRIPLSMAQKLKGIIRDGRIYLWNGFNKSNSVIVSGRCFSLSAVFDNLTLKAEGVVMTPPGYDENHVLLVNFLTGLVKRYYTEIEEC